MALIQNWLPPSRENWQFVVWLWQFFPLVTLLQWMPFIDKIYAMGKTSSNSRFNIPGRIAWITMELPGPLTLLYCVYTLPQVTNLSTGLPWENKVLASFYVLHYINRAIIAPLIAPSISPMSPLVWAFAAIFQLSNGLALGAWLGGYGPRSRAEWQGEANYKAGGRMELGMMIFFLGLLGNLFHDDELREIRRAAARNQARLESEKNEKGGKKSVDKVYMIPQNGGFNWILYPHYLLEWIEWAGFYIMCGAGCVPARNFLVNEISTMLPRAVSGKQWYIERFGKEKVAGRKAIIPGIL